MCSFREETGNSRRGVEFGRRLYICGQVGEIFRGLLILYMTLLVIISWQCDNSTLYLDFSNIWLVNINMGIKR